MRLAIATYITAAALAVSVRATAEGEELRNTPVPPPAAAAAKAKTHTIADGVDHYHLVQRAAKLVSENKKDAGGPLINQDDFPSDRRVGMSCSDKLDKCRSKLDKCEAEADAPTLLFTQMGQTCKLKRKERGDDDDGGKYYYEWSSKDMDDETYVFSDRPYRIAYSMPTEEFFENFDDTFSEETGGRPNGVMTLRHKDTNEFEGPLIAVYVEAVYKKSSGKFVYELSQSKDQKEVNALDEFFEDGDVVEYESCSLFIDTISDGKIEDDCDYGCTELHWNSESNYKDCMNECMGCHECFGDGNK